MAHWFTVIFEKEDEDSYHVFRPTLPGVTRKAKLEEGVKNIREAIKQPENRSSESMRLAVQLTILASNALADASEVPPATNLLNDVRRTKNEN